MEVENLKIEALNLEAQGIAHRSDGKVVFIDGALPFEQVQVSIRRHKNRYDQGSLIAIERESAQRVQPGCPHFGLHTGACGGCKMQHLHAYAQVAIKQRVLEDNLWHLAKLKPEHILRPITGPTWGYRYRARLSVRYVHKKNTVLIGFHERNSRYIADMQQCPVLPEQMSSWLMPLRELIGSLQARETVPQIELACGDDRTVLVLRHMQPLSDHDLTQLRTFAAERPGLQWWLQPKGPDTAHPLDEPHVGLTYSLPEFGLRMSFQPTDFTQVNPHINRALVSRAMRLLDLRPDERVIDWFCGLGNFTLALATQAHTVLGIEGSETLVQRARQNFVANQAARANRQTLAATEFAARDLFAMTASDLLADGLADKWLIDPPRDGALALVKALADLRQQAPDNWKAPQRIVYVSCNPATLARDAGVLVGVAGYRCVAAGVVNMFPHTAHVESIALFEKTQLTAKNSLEEPMH